MAVVHPSVRSATVEIAGSAWPVYKLEALAAGLVTCLILAMITGSPQLAVLVAAAVGVGRWLVGVAATRRAANRQ
ncbi:hypothetical protein [Nocardia altamirensis]|uniref:hypothetical protein n=1 Tax=Nocardia altamirensis TaxID=472158 RepID=UPI00084025CF|nr:hypothetical protein [Nocardia altamirensis]